jgi:hypothetical protein
MMNESNLRRREISLCNCSERKESGIFTPDPNRPVIFHLRKKGETESLAVLRGNMNVPGMGRKFSLPTNGVPVGIDFLRGKRVDAGGQVAVQ